MACSKKTPMCYLTVVNTVAASLIFVICFRTLSLQCKYISLTLKYNFCTMTWPHFSKHLHM